MTRNLTDIFSDILKEQVISVSDFIIKKHNKPDLSISIRLCKKEELTEILALQSIVYRRIAAKETFIYTTEEELSESLEADVCIGAYHHNSLIAFTLMVSNPESSRNLGYCLNYNQQQCLKCVTYDTTFVHPDYNGYGLQRLFISLKDSIARELGACEALATVSPENITSLDNLKAGGFVIADEKKMYGVLNRYIMRKTLV